MAIFYYVISFFLIINIIVFVHEYGHYLAAKKVGVKVTSFSLGMGPEIFGFCDKHGTRWSFSMLPIGGYIMMLGDGDIASSTVDEKSMETLSDEEKKQSFNLKNNWEKMFIAFNGPLFNYIYSFFVIAVMACFCGVPVYKPIIGEVLKSSPAESAGLLAGDKIISVDGKKVEKYREVGIGIADNESGNIQFAVQRNEKIMTINVVPTITETKRLIGGVSKIKVVGIKSVAPIFQKKSFVDSLVFSFGECVSATKEMCNVLAKLFAGKKSIDDFGGIVRMVSVAGDLSQSGNFILLIMFTASLSLNLGFINLFPLPVLDGGRIVISFFEEITRRKFNPKVQEYIMIACAILLIFLMLITTVNDVLRIESVGKFVSNLLG